MLKNILIGLDGSAFSDSAVELGFRWARQFNAFLIGLGVVDEPSVRDSGAVPSGASGGGSVDAGADEARRRVAEFLERFAIRCLEASVPAKLVEKVGLPSERILLEAQRYDLILLGQQSYFQAATHQSPCATLEKVLRNSPRPVVTVPAKLADGTSVVVAYDGSLQAARAVQAFQALGLDRSEPVHVVSVAAEHATAARHADRAVEFLRSHEINVTPRPLASAAPPAEVILEQARQLGARLLVMGAYGQPAIREFFFGSVTRTVLKESPVPLFLYH
jgi:nucleotide-binding universal stress UspA family protein